MDIKKLQTIVVDSLEDVKGQDIRVFDTMHLTAEYDRIAIASGTSNRQTKALAASVRDKVKENGGTVNGIEGEDTGEWVLVDLGSMVVHIMQPAIRDYYRLEELWGGKEVKFGAAKRVSKRSASPSEDEKPAPRKRSAYEAVAASQTSIDDDEDAPKKPARKTAATKTAAKTAAKTTTKSAGSAPARKTAAKTPRTPVGKTVRVAASKSASAPKKTATKRAAAKKTAA